MPDTRCPFFVGDVSFHMKGAAADSAYKTLAVAAEAEGAVHPGGGRLRIRDSRECVVIIMFCLPSPRGRGEGGCLPVASGGMG
jgi:hypothetical protein